AERTERAWNREVVAGAREHAGSGAEVLDEAGDERGLADPRLAGHEDDAAHSAGRGVVRVDQGCQRLLALEELHPASVDGRGLRCDEVEVVHEIQHGTVIHWWVATRPDGQRIRLSVSG